MELSLQEILDWCQTEKKRFWEYMLYDDMTQRGASREESFAYMEKIFDTMEQTVKTYRQERLSASGLVGAEGGWRRMRKQVIRFAALLWKKP